MLRPADSDFGFVGARDQPIDVFAERLRRLEVLRDALGRAASGSQPKQIQSQRFERGHDVGQSLLG